MGRNLKTIDQESRQDLLLRALASGTRRRIVRHLMQRPSTVAELCHEIPEHTKTIYFEVGVLHRAQLVRNRAKTGRHVIHEVDPDVWAEVRAIFEPG
ncbi:ArsR family transcriptional regulator [bacterium]|nr:MAG: ArsR family transcriptional regulator [bacterium]